VEDCFEFAVQAAHAGGKAGSIHCAMLFAHYANEFGLKGGMMFIQNLIKSQHDWHDPRDDWLGGIPNRLPCEMTMDPTVCFSSQFRVIQNHWSTVALTL
jgi:hypothetical protein